MEIKKVLKEQVGIIKPTHEVLDNISESADGFVLDLRSRLKARKIAADVFVGGSLAKDTIVKKDKLQRLLV